MGYVITETERRGMLRVTCPARAVGEYAKVSAMTASRTLSALTKKGLLVRYSRGRPGKVGNGRAAIYALVDPETLRHGDTDSARQSRTQIHRHGSFSYVPPTAPSNWASGGCATGL